MTHEERKLLQIFPFAAVFVVSAHTTFAPFHFPYLVSELVSQVP